MIRIDDLQLFPPHLRGGVLCIGNFDGVHRGHALMLDTGRQTARRLGVPFVIMTFEPHPGFVLRPDAPPLPLTTLDQRLELLSAFDPAAVAVVPTTRPFLSLTAEEFLQQILHAQLATPHIVEGANFTFGRGAKGGIAMLQEVGPRYGFDVTIVPTVTRTLSDLTLVNVSSSLVRWLIGQGRVADAARCLGRPFALRGQVVLGAQRGRTIGFPTANLRTLQLIPAPGVYAGSVRVAGRPFHAAISVGTNPTFAGRQTTVEAYLLDFSGDLYGQTIEIAFTRWLRDLEKYAGIEPLVRQMHRDVAAVRDLASVDTASLNEALAS